MSVPWAWGMLQNDFVRELQKLEPEISKVNNLVVLCASDVDQQAWPAASRGLTVFTDFLLKGLQGEADDGREDANGSDGNSDGRVSVLELAKYVQKKVPRWVHAAHNKAEQTPFLLPAGAEGEGRARNIDLVLVGGDRAANAYAENQMASQVQSSLALSGKPNVTIQGFPFLTQVAARTFNTVDVNASNETAGPGGQLQIASLTATLHGMHIHGTNSATVDQFTASALVTFTALAHAGGIPQGITLAPAGPNQLKATVDILGFSSDATAKVTQVGDNKINVKITNFGGVPADVLGSLTDFTFSIPKLPAGVKIQSVSVTQQGIRITAAGQNTTLSQ